MEKEWKCSNCNNWNEATSTGLFCSKCGNPHYLESEEEKKSIKKRLEINNLNIPIYPGDNIFIKVLKNVFNFIQFIFLAIVSFFFWLIALGPG
jgi:hypothetical protein